MSYSNRWRRNGLLFLKSAAVALFVTTLLAAPAAEAGTTAKDIQVILKAIGFLASKPTGNVNVAVVFDPSNAASKADAESIKTLLDGAKGGAVVPVAKTVGLDQLATLDALVAVVAAGVSPAGLDAMSAAVKGRKILTVSTDESCVRTAKCVLSIQSDPKVVIMFNVAAAIATGVDFQPNILMMITAL